MICSREQSEQYCCIIRLLTLCATDNPFHNFEHASHVSMSVDKLLHRVVTPDIHATDEEEIEQNLHDYTFGITSDPLTHFAVVFAALIHDVDRK